MTHTATVAPSVLLRALLDRSCRITLLLALLTLFTGNVLAQQTKSSTDGSTPLALQPGQPAGSFALSGFDNVNPYNGNLNFHLPLLGIGGRGDAQMTMMLAIDSKGWQVKHKEVLVPDPECPQCQTYAMSNIPEPNRWGPTAGYGAGTLYGRSSGVGSNTCAQGGATSYGSTLTRLTFATADGTEYELRDQLYAGQPQPVTGGVCNGGRVAVSRGTVFTSADGNAATFISDQPISDKAYQGPSGTEYTYPSGYLMLKDGTRYRIDNGQITWMRDRNGNKLSFTYAGNVTTVTDSLNRKVTVETNITDVAPYGVCDRITYRGFGGAQRVIRVSKTSLSNVLRAGFTVKTYKLLFPELNGSSTTTWNPTRVSTVWMPDARSYKLFYNSYGELARVELPTGGAIEYDYNAGSGCIDEMGSKCTDTLAEIPQIFRRVTTRRLYKEGGVLEQKQTFSDPGGACAVYPCAGDATITVDHLSGAGGRMLREKHYYFGNAVESLWQGPTSYPSWKNAREYKTETHDSASTDASPKLLRVVDNTWAQRTPLPVWIGNQASASQPAHDVRLTQAVTTLADTGTDPYKVSKQTFTYDQHNNQTDVYEYDYGDGVVGPFRRRTHTDYVTSNTTGGVSFDYDSDSTIHIRNLPKQQWVSSDGAGNLKKAITTYEYDNHTPDTYHAALLARTAISGLDASFTSAKKTRGNVTSVSRRLIEENRDITTYQFYDVAGNVYKTIDAEGKATTFYFDDRYGAPDDNEAQSNVSPAELTAAGDRSYAFATQVKNALNHLAYTQFDYYTGKPVNAEDPNGTVYSGYYADNLDRPTKLVKAYPDAALRTQTKFIYDDLNRKVTTTSDRSLYDDDVLKGEIVYDGLGRTVETRQYEDATNHIRVDQQYDGLGRVSKKSNPYRPLAGETQLWTTTTYDELGRAIVITTPDNAKVNTTYKGNITTVRDQALKYRESTVDALGRLVEVVEDPGTGGLNYQTTYQYDVLDNLLKVLQGGQTRTFTYDSLKRLTQAVNPESGTIKYEYDDNGNLLKKIDPRKITISPLVYLETSFAYDALSRVISKTYNDNGMTPNVIYKYDAQVLPAGAPASTVFDRGASTGRLVSVTYGGTASGTYYGYDGLGRVIERVQQTDGANYEVDATYNRAGALLKETYPVAAPATTRRAVTHTFDGAGRLASLSTAGASVTGIKYASHGALSEQSYGTLLHQISYNTRLQPTAIQLGTSAAPTSRLNLAYTYGGTTNNGNVLSSTISIDAEVWNQTFTYDPLNRIDTAKEVKAAVTQWSQSFDYDQYGNRCIRTTAGVECAPAVNAANNRLTGKSYDLAGNQLSDDVGHTYTYDAENHIKSVDGAAAYVYDGEGQRVRKLTGENLRMVYGISGGLIAEFDGTDGTLKKEYIFGADGLAATIATGEGTRYVTADHLGSPRIITSTTGAVVSRHDYQPFGEELFAGIGSRTTTQGYNSPADSLRQKFTGKERDNETGLDYFGARHYTSIQGRFTSPDNPAFSKGTDPQTWNLYAYTANNPLSRVDPNGRDWFQIGNGYGARFEWHKGKKHTYKDENGNEQQAKNVGTHLLVFEITGTNSDDAVVGTLTLYEQNEVVAQNTNAFSGGDPSWLPGDQYNSIPVGVYSILTDDKNRSVAKDKSAQNPDGSLKHVYGLQEIQIEGAKGSWGSKRAAINEWDRNLPIAYRGNFIHGRQNPGDYTAGCVCDRGETVLGALFKINSKVTPRVRMVVTDGPPKQGDSRPGPYVVRP